MPAESGPGTWLGRAAATHPARLGMVSSKGDFDFRALAERTAGLAARFSGSGLVPGQPLAVLSRSRLRIAWATYLALHCGCPLLPLDPRRPALLRLLRTCGVGQVIADEGLSLPVAARTLPAAWLDAAGDGSVRASCPAPASAVQVIIPTSGTGSVHRGVLLTGRNIEAAVLASQSRLALAVGDIWLLCLPLFHIGGLSVLLRSLWAGATVVVHDAFDAAMVWADLASRRVTHLSLVPPMLERLLAVSGPAPPPDSLRFVLVGGGFLSGVLMERAQDAGWPVCPSYGLSENASQVATLCPAPTPWEAGDVGLPLDGVHVDIVDKGGRAARGRGYIRVSGGALMAGYADAGLIPGTGLQAGSFVTDDLGYLDERGHLHVVGRADHVLVSAGETVHPEEIEERLARHPGISDVGVTGVSDAIWGERIVAVMVGPAATETLRTWCHQHLPSPLRPREFLVAPALPRNAMGKLDRQALRDWVAEKLHHGGAAGSEAEDEASPAS